MRTIILIAITAGFASAGFCQSMLDDKPPSAARLVSDRDNPFPQAGDVVRADFIYMGTYFRGAEVVGEVKDGLAQVVDLDNRKGTVAIKDLPPALRKVALDRQAEDEAQASPTPNPNGEINTGAQVTQVIPDGLLISMGDHEILLRGYPDAGSVADGDVVRFRALPDGVFQYTTALGTQATIHAYRCEQ